MLERAGKQLSALSALLLTLSVVYDHFYLQALGLSFAVVPTTLSDHLRSAIIWLPYFSVALILGVLYGTWTLEAASTSNKLGRRWIIDDIIFWTLIGGWVVIAWRQRPMGFGIVLAGVGSLCIFHFRLGATRVESLFGKPATSAILAIPTALVMIAGAGYFQGENALEEASPLWRISLRSESGVQTVLLTGYRSFGNAAVIVDASHAVKVVSPESIVELTPQAARPKLFRCYFLDVFCPSGESS